ncbi:PAS domain-containing protein [uncultured Methanolobus sp.]|uniref:PAS domain-containing protein n=1 Tax=uncultured Methanolobus sp. TaxID=218300 RepID=UPI0029C7475D|nr:PAS domain-containing protein [uncultured Methanolobus sp.]
MSSKIKSSFLEEDIKLVDYWGDGILVLSANGIVSYANKIWDEFAQKYCPSLLEYVEGTDYLKVFSEKSDENVTITKGIRRVINGTEKSFFFEDSCHCSDGEHWILIKVHPLSQNYPTSVLLQYIDITENKKRELNLAEHEKHLYTLLNNIRLVGVVLDTHGNIKFCNDHLLELTGWKRKEVLNKNWFDILLSPEIVPEIKSVFLKTIKKANVPSYYKNEVLAKDGSRRLIVWNNTVIKDIDGKINTVVSIGENITNHLLTEKSLLMTKGQLRTLVDTIPDLVWLKDVNGFYLVCNTKFERFFGAKEEEIIGKTDYDFVNKDLADLFTQKDREAMKAGKPSMNEEEITYADDGHREYLETIKSPMYDSNGQLIGVLGVGRDITERKKSEAKLQDKKKELFQIVNGNPIPTFVINKNHKITYWNKSCETITGIKADEMIGTRNTWTAFYRNERPLLADLIVDNCQSTIEKIYGGKNLQPSFIEGGYQAEDYFPMFDKWLFFTAAPIKDFDNNIIGAIETLQDISLAKKAEKALIDTKILAENRPA